VIDLAVGAPGTDDGGGPVADRGAVWIVFLHADGTVRAQQRSATRPAASGAALRHRRVGIGVAALGDLDADGLPDLAAGARALRSRRRSHRPRLGAVPERGRNGQDEAEISTQAGGFDGVLDSSDDFGGAVATAGDVDDDGVVDLVVGALFDDGRRR
jgi:hypothetical protein